MSRRVKDENMQPATIADELRMPEDLRVAHGRRLMNIRKEHKYSQEKLAELLGRSASYIAGVEHGKISLTVEEYYAICKLYQISIDYLFEDLISVSKENKVYQAIKDDFTGKEIEAIKRFCAYIQRL